MSSIFLSVFVGLFSSLIIPHTERGIINPRNGMVRVVLERQKKIYSNGFVLPELSQADFSRANTVYVIRSDFDMKGKTISLPSNCVLEFEGGSITGGKLVGECINDYLDVTNFTITENIDEALDNIYAICNDAYIPKGDFKLARTHSFASKKRLFGKGLDSRLHLSKYAFLYVNRKEYVTIENLSILLDQNSDNPALLIDGMRYCHFNNLNIHSEASYSLLNNQTGILLRQSSDNNDYYGSTLSNFNKITISHVKYGVVLDCTVIPSRDYITSCTFTDVLIFAFVDTGVIIKGKRIYANTFNNLTIQDAYTSNVDRKGIDFGGSSGDFQGGYSNYFNNLTIWADGKGGEKNFYALYLSSGSSVIKSPTYITGCIEGLIGSSASDQAKWVFLSYFRYNVFLTLVDSKSKKVYYNGRLSNYLLDGASNFNNLMDLNYYVNHVLTANNYEIKNNTIVFTRDDVGDIYTEVNLPYKFNNEVKLKLLALIECDGNAEMQLISNDVVIEYKEIGTASNLEWTDTKSELTGEYNSIKVVISAANAKCLKVKKIYLVSYSIEKGQNYPWFIFTNADLLFRQMNLLQVK